MIDRRVAVFGASGFIGRHAVRALAKGGFGYRVRAVVRNPTTAAYLQPMGHVGQIQPLRANVRNADEVARAIADVDAVVNLVGILNPAGGQSFHAMHVEAAAAIARAAREAGVRSLVHVSAAGIGPQSESVYARSKAEGEIALRREFPAATILRPSLVFGPEDNFFNKFANLARFAPALPLIGGGHTRFQPVWVADVARAIVTCIENPATEGQTYELGGPTVYSFKQMLQTILQVTARRRLLVPIPFSLAKIPAFFLQFLPGKLLTPDQVTLLKTDNVVADGAFTLRHLGIEPEPLEAVLPSYLWRFRKKGQFENSAYERVIGTPATR